MKIVWLRQALRNLDDIAARIAVEDPIVASLVVERVMHSAALLSEQPLLGRPGRVEGTRELLVRKTRLVLPYRTRAGRLEILRVFHSSRRSPPRW